MTAAADTRALTAALNRAARRVLRAERQGEWTLAVLDAAREFCERVALFTVQADRLKLELAPWAPAAEISVPLSEAPALAEAVATLEPVATAWTPREVSLALTVGLAPWSPLRVHLFPVPHGSKAAAVLLAEGNVDPNGLELTATLAGAAWELRVQRNASAPAASTVTAGLVQVAPVPAAAPDDELHRRARRFASVRVAELQLYHGGKVRDGRAAGQLYEVFQEEIDRDRATFRQEFLGKGEAMADYYHEELVRALALGDAGRLGEKYPGAMVLDS
ncbi:MAG: hypothetical protein IT162_20195 [Bryobacterales bacterium]|nr:hypothetical protein [Bryobacterales bacterium]